MSNSPTSQKLRMKF